MVLVSSGISRPKIMVADICAHNSNFKVRVQLEDHVGLVEGNIGQLHDHFKLGISKLQIYSSYFDTREIKIAVLDEEAYGENYMKYAYEPAAHYFRHDFSMPSAAYNLLNDRIEIPSNFPLLGLRSTESREDLFTAFLHSLTREDLPDTTFIKRVRCGLAFFYIEKINDIYEEEADGRLVVRRKMNYHLNGAVADFLRILAGGPRLFNEYLGTVEKLFDFSESTSAACIPIVYAYFTGDIKYLEGYFGKEGLKQLSKETDDLVVNLMSQPLPPADQNGRVWLQ